MLRADTERERGREGGRTMEREKENEKESGRRKAREKEVRLQRPGAHLGMALTFHPYTLNPEAQTLNLKPSTLSPQPKP